MQEAAPILSLAARPATRTHVDVAQHALAISSAAIARTAGRLGPDFEAAVALILSCRQRVIVSGIGKSGLVARKIAATMSSLGTPAAFVHSADAAHGDLGMICSGDVCVLISASGESKEVSGLLPYLKRLEVPVVALTGDRGSTVGRHADVVLDCSIEREACAHNLAPTTSTLVAMALGDALAIALGEARDFRPVDFARFHPGGTIGQRLTTAVRDVMHRENLPICAPDAPIRRVLPAMSAGRLGMVLVMRDGQLEGIITDGDIRRGFEADERFAERAAAEVMSATPLTIGPDVSLFDADEALRKARVTALVVTDSAGQVLGIFQIHD
jgi:arabinose-5-phosphate isomerase